MLCVLTAVCIDCVVCVDCCVFVLTVLCVFQVQQPPFCLPHARKARALLHSHLSHVMLPRELSEGVS